MDKKKIKSTLFISILLVICFGTVIIERINYQKSIKNNIKVTLTNDYSMFFAIDECADKYINYISSNDVNSLLKVLNEEYKNTNNINESNIISKLDNLSISNKMVSFKTKKMYQQIIDNNITKYYLSGKVYLEEIDENKEYASFYLIVNYNKDTLIYDITPYDGEIFREK